EPHRLRIAAVRARANDREVVGGRRAAIFGLENCQARHLRVRGQRPSGQPRKHEGTKEDLISWLRVFVAIHGAPVGSHVLKCRVASEYSSICAVRSRGYEMVKSVISPAPLVTASSFGITKAL